MQNDKPIIRHCLNCKYSKPAICFEAWCDVRYKWVSYPRLRAWICRYYKAKGGVDNAG